MYEYEPVHTPRFDTFGRPRDARLFTRPPHSQVPTAPHYTLEPHVKPPQAILLLTPRAQPTVVWPMSPLEETSSSLYCPRNPLVHYMQPQQEQRQRQHFLPPTYVAVEPDPLANYRRFPLPSPPTQTPIYEAPMLIPCEEFTPRNYNPRKTLWKPRLTNKVYTPRDFQPRAIMPRTPNNPISPTFEQKNVCTIHPPSSSFLSSTSSHQPNFCHNNSASIPLPQTPQLSNPSLVDKATPSSAPSPPASLPVLPSAPVAPPVSFTTPGVQKRRKKQAKSESSTALATASNFWTIVTWKSSRWLLSHEKAVVRLLLCLLLVGAFLLAMTMESKSNEVVVEAENWSRARYDWIDNL